MVFVVKCILKFLNVALNLFYFLLNSGRPNSPKSVEVTCEVTHAILQWKSSFNGGDRQSFVVVSLNGQDGSSYSITTPDKGENLLHISYIKNLQSSTKYAFYVFAQNIHGNSSSENITCMTSKQGIFSCVLVHLNWWIWSLAVRCPSLNLFVHV